MIKLKWWLKDFKDGFVEHSLLSALAENFNALRNGWTCGGIVALLINWTIVLSLTAGIVWAIIEGYRRIP